MTDDSGSEPTAQRYTHPVAHARMALGECPECGRQPTEHTSDNRFWMPRECSLMPLGVSDRIAQYKRDLRAAERSTAGGA